MDENDFERIGQIIAHHVGVVHEAFLHKLDLVVEGHQVLGGKLDLLEARMDRLETRMDGL